MACRDITRYRVLVIKLYLAGRDSSYLSVDDGRLLLPVAFFVAVLDIPCRAEHAWFHEMFTDGICLGLVECR